MIHRNRAGIVLQDWKKWKNDFRGYYGEDKVIALTDLMPGIYYLTNQLIIKKIVEI